MKQRGAAVHEAVLGAAIRLLTEPGVTSDSITVAKIASLADVSPSSVYRRWGTREALLSDAIGRLLSGEDEVASEGDLEADLIAFVVRLQDFLSTPAGRVLAHLSTVPDREGEGPDRRRFWAHRYEQVGELVEAARLRGELPDSVPTDLVLSAVSAPIHLAALTDGALPDVSAVSLVKLVLNGVRGFESRGDGVAE